MEGRAGWILGSEWKAYAGRMLRSGRAGMEGRAGGMLGSGRRSGRAGTNASEARVGPGGTESQAGEMQVRAGWIGWNG